MIERKMFYDESEDRLIIAATQDVEDILKHTSELRSMGNAANRSKDRSFYHLAEVPLIVVEQWMKEGINIFKREHWPLVKKKLNDFDNARLRVWEGRI